MKLCRTSVYHEKENTTVRFWILADSTEEILKQVKEMGLEKEIEIEECKSIVMWSEGIPLCKKWPFHIFSNPVSIRIK